MSAVRSADQCAPRHRQNLPRQRKNIRFELRQSVYTRLLELAGDGEPLVAVVERLILESRHPDANRPATGCTPRRSEYVHELRETLERMA